MRVEVLGGVERRRRWSRDDEMRIIEATVRGNSLDTLRFVFTWVNNKGRM
jgi:transposase